MLSSICSIPDGRQDTPRLRTSSIKDGECHIVPENTRHGCMIRMDQVEYDAIMMLWELNPPAA